MVKGKRRVVTIIVVVLILAGLGVGVVVAWQTGQAGLAISGLGDIPLYPGAQPMTPPGAQRQVPASALISYTITDPPPTVLTYYKTWFTARGWACSQFPGGIVCDMRKWRQLMLVPTRYCLGVCIPLVRLMVREGGDKVIVLALQDADQPTNLWLELSTVTRP